MYIGSSIHLKKRLREHETKLKAGNHDNTKLRNASKKYGANAFILKIELVCDEQNRYLYEQLLIDFYDSAKQGYNINHKAERGFSKPLEPLSDEFFKSRTDIDANGCHVFNGALGGNGMAKVKRAGKFVSLQRLAYEFYVGEIPEGMYIYRICKNRTCINPNHLKIGDRSAIASHTFNTGRKHPRGNVVLTESIVREIKMSDEPMLRLAKKYGVSDGTIRKIKRGETWKHVNVRVIDEDPTPLEPFKVEPTHPRRVWG